MAMERPLTSWADGHDPVAEDPRQPDLERPAAMFELAIPVAGTRMNGHVYVAAGAGPHPAVVLLHGYPGNERSLDLAQALRRGGMDVLFFHYRGSWGSGGLFSWKSSAEDVEAALRFLRTPAARERYRVDPERIALVGHSLGAWLSLFVAARAPEVRAAVALGLENLGADARLYQRDEGEREAWLAYLRSTVGEGLPIRAESAEALFAEQQENADAFDLIPLAPALRDRPVLLVGGTRDWELPPAEHQHPVADALRRAGSTRVEDVVLEADHSFSDCRIELCRLVLAWLQRALGL